MANFRYIEPAVKQLLVQQAARHRPSRVSSNLDIHRSTVHKVVRYWKETGSVRQAILGRPRTLGALDCLFLEGCIERRCDYTVQELQEMLATARGVVISQATVIRTLRRRGFSRKRVARDAVERSEEARERFQLLAGTYAPETLVFVDESAYNRHVSRRMYGWAPIGTRARRRDCFIRGTRYCILPAMSLDGILHVTVQPRSYTGATFRVFIDTLLDTMNPYPQPNSVIVMDNASIHKGDGLRQMIEARGMRLLYLPPYSPDLNPIEEAFSSIKAWIRRNHDYVLGEMTGEATCDPYGVLWEAVFSVTPEKAWSWFRDSGYVA